MTTGFAMLSCLAAVTFIAAPADAATNHVVRATATQCSASGAGGVAVCDYLAMSPLGELTTSGPVYVIVTCTVGGTSSPGLFVQAGECRVLATFAGPGSFDVGGVPV